MRWGTKHLQRACRGHVGYHILNKKVHKFSIVTRDSGNDGEEGVTTEINKKTQCDLRD
jgi:hypothetical protein